MANSLKKNLSDHKYYDVFSSIIFNLSMKLCSEIELGAKNSLTYSFVIFYLSSVTKYLYCHHFEVWIYLSIKTVFKEDIKKIITLLFVSP